MTSKKNYICVCLCGCNNLPRYQMSSTPTKYDINYQDNLLKACNDVMRCFSMLKEKSVSPSMRYCDERMKNEK